MERPPDMFQGERLPGMLAKLFYRYYVDDCDVRRGNGGKQWVKHVEFCAAPVVAG